MKSDLISKLAASYRDEVLENLLDLNTLNTPPEVLDAMDDRLRQELAAAGVPPGKDLELAVANVILEILEMAMAGEPH